MLNLLFITNNSKAVDVSKVLQPLLTVIIDVVPNFDHGLKDVFEKRPATVCIQENIAGVTGESVARHIQMLLGSAAPRFILLHEGNSKAKAIKGLFELLIDLNQPHDDLAADFQRTLKSLLGEQWDKIYIPPKQTADSIRKSVGLTQESRENADKLVNDFISDLDSGGGATGTSSGEVTVKPVEEVRSDTPELPEPSETVVDGLFQTQSNSDELAELLKQQSVSAHLSERAGTSGVPNVPSGQSEAPSKHPAAGGSTPAPQPSVSQSRDTAPAGAGFAVTKAPAVEKQPAAVVTPPKPAATPPSARPLAPAAVRPTPAPVARTQSSDFTVSAPSQRPTKAASDRNIPAAEEPIPEDFLQAFDANYRSESFFGKRSVLVALVLLVVVVAAGWYIMSQNPKYLTALKQRFKPSSAPVAVAKKPVQQPQKTDTTAGPSPAAPVQAPPSLPSFIPREGHDPAFSAQNTGWDRYTDGRYDFRLFRNGTALKALQILALNGGNLPAEFTRTVLKEVAGDSEYSVTTRETKLGLLMQRGIVKDKAEVLFYSKNGKVQALVIEVK